MCKGCILRWPSRRGLRQGRGALPSKEDRSTRQLARLWNRTTRNLAMAQKPGAASRHPPSRSGPPPPARCKAEVSACRWPLCPAPHTRLESDPAHSANSPAEGEGLGLLTINMLRGVCRMPMSEAEAGHLPRPSRSDKVPASDSAPPARGRRTERAPCPRGQTSRENAGNHADTGSTLET
jgi:hypothetical protein